MWTTVLVITLYSSVWCIHGHIQWFMSHNLLFPKVASPSQCASLWRDVRHARVRWLCWQIFRTSQTWNKLWREAERVAKFIQNVTNIFIFHLTKAFDPPRLADIYNLTKSPTAKSLTGTLQRIRSAPETQLCQVWLKTIKRFYSDGKWPLDGTWCQRNNCQSSYRGEITPEETDR